MEWTPCTEYCIHKTGVRWRFPPYSDGINQGWVDGDLAITAGEHVIMFPDIELESKEHKDAIRR